MSTKVGDRTVLVCESTGQEVVAEYEGEASAEYGGWLHLHNDDVADDVLDAEDFQAKMYEPEWRPRDRS